MKKDPIDTAKDQLRLLRASQREGQAILRRRGGRHGEPGYSRRSKHKKGYDDGC